MSEVTGNSSGLNLTPDDTLAPTDAEKLIINELKADIIFNEMMTRTGLLKQFFDKRRNINIECGYPDVIRPKDYQYAFDRNGLANRIISFEAKESWGEQPEIYEVEDEDIETQFEIDIKELNQQLATGGQYKNFLKDPDNKMSPIWYYLRKVDILSGIGAYGVLLYGFNDLAGEGGTVDYAQPVAGFTETNSTPADFYPDRYKDGKKKQSATFASGGNPPEKDPTKKNTTPTTNKKKAARAERNSRIDQIVNNMRKTKSGVYKLTFNLQLQQEKLPEPDEVDEEEGVEDKPEPQQGVEGKKKKLQLLYLRAYPEYLAQIVRWESNPTSPRYGMPVMYLLTLNDPSQVTQYSGVGMDKTSMYVHWTRVQHVAEADESCNEALAVPRLQTTFDDVYNALKIKSADGEGFWKNAFSILSVETNPNLGGDVDIDETATKRTIENLTNSLQRSFLGKGLTLKSVAPTISDPTPHLDMCIRLICIAKGWPKRKFEGSERGELASSQDETDFIRKMENRQQYYLSPRLISVFFSSMVSYGVITEPEEGGFMLEWPEMLKESPTQKAQRFLTRAQAYGAVMSTGVTPNVFSMKDVMTKLDDLSGEEADAINEAALKETEQQMAGQIAMEQDQADAMADAGYIDPEDAEAGLTPDAIAQAKQLEAEIPPPKPLTPAKGPPKK